MAGSHQVKTVGLRECTLASQHVLMHCTCVSGEVASIQIPDSPHVWGMLTS
jgi:hypothetical protein